jgi:hypothetical protein
MMKLFKQKCANVVRNCFHLFLMVRSLEPFKNKSAGSTVLPCVQVNV